MSWWEDPKPGFKWPVAAAQQIAAPADKVWDVISMHSNLEPCHPFCAQNPVEAWPGAQSRDRIHYLNGVVFERRFCTWIEGVGYDLNIGRPGGKTSFVSWRIRPVDSETAILRIAVYPYVMQHLPGVVRWIPHIFSIRPMLTSYLSAVTKGYEWYVTRNKPVPRNQFGSHPWFSDRTPPSRSA